MYLLAAWQCHKVLCPLHELHHRHEMCTSSLLSQSWRLHELSLFLIPLLHLLTLVTTASYHGRLGKWNHGLASLTLNCLIAEPPI